MQRAGRRVSDAPSAPSTHRCRWLRDCCHAEHNASSSFRFRQATIIFRDEWSFGWHAMKVFVVLKVAERRLLVMISKLRLPSWRSESFNLSRILATILYACLKASFLQIIDERSLSLVSIVSHDVQVDVVIPVRQPTFISVSHCCSVLFLTRSSSIVCSPGG